MAEADWRNSVDASIHGLLVDMNSMSNIKTNLEGYVQNVEAELKRDVTVQMNERLTAIEGRIPNEQEYRDVIAHEVRRQPITVPTQPPPRYQEGDDPETYILQYRLICESNGWDNDILCRLFPANLPATLLPWFIQLEIAVKHDLDRLAAAFKERFSVGYDRQNLMLSYHNLRARNCASLDVYAMRVQTLGIKLNKSNADNLAQFMLGLPDGAYRWVEARRPERIEEALLHAVDYERMFGRHVRFKQNNQYYNSSVRQEEPMELGQRGYPAERGRMRSFGGNRGRGRYDGYQQRYQAGN